MNSIFNYIFGLDINGILKQIKDYIFDEKKPLTNIKEINKAIYDKMSIDEIYFILNKLVSKLKQLKAETQWTPSLKLNTIVVANLSSVLLQSLLQKIELISERPIYVIKQSDLMIYNEIAKLIGTKLDYTTLQFIKKFRDNNYMNYLKGFVEDVKQFCDSKYSIFNFRNHKMRMTYDENKNDIRIDLTRANMGLGTVLFEISLFDDIDTIRNYDGAQVFKSEIVTLMIDYIKEYEKNEKKIKPYLEKEMAENDKIGDTYVIKTIKYINKFISLILNNETNKILNTNFKSLNIISNYDYEDFKNTIERLIILKTNVFVVQQLIYLIRSNNSSSIRHYDKETFTKKMGDVIGNMIPLMSTVKNTEFWGKYIEQMIKLSNFNTFLGFIKLVPNVKDEYIKKNFEKIIEGNKPEEINISHYNSMNDDESNYSNLSLHVSPPSPKNPYLNENENSNAIRNLNQNIINVKI